GGKARGGGVWGRANGPPRQRWRPKAQAGSPVRFAAPHQRKVVQMRRKRWYSRAPIYASRCFLTHERDTLMASNATSTTSTSKTVTVTLRHLDETHSESHELPKKQVMSMLEDMVTTVTKHLKRGARIRIGALPIPPTS